MWVAIHKCMEVMLGISLYGYLYPKLAKILCLIISYFSSTKLEKRVEQDLPGSRCCRGPGVQGGGTAIYAHVGKCKNYKIKGERKNKNN
jgi:hypothetical protein